MSANFPPSRPLLRGVLCALVLLALVAALAPARAAAADAGAVAAPLAPTPLLADRFGWFWSFLENTLNNRARMLQFGVVGMCVALYFMFRARG